MNPKALASVLVEHLNATINEKDVERILFRNTRFLPPQFWDEYQSLVFLEANELGSRALDARAFERLCNRISKRLLYAAKQHSDRFTPLEALEEEPAVQEQTDFRLSELLENLTLEEQNLVIMKMDGLTLEEMAKKLHIPVSTVHNHWKTLSRKLKRLLR